MLTSFHSNQSTLIYREAQGFPCTQERGEKMGWRLRGGMRRGVLAAQPYSPLKGVAGSASRLCHLCFCPACCDRYLRPALGLGVQLPCRGPSAPPWLSVTRAALLRSLPADWLTHPAGCFWKQTTSHNSLSKWNLPTQASLIRGVQDSGMPDN